MKTMIMKGTLILLLIASTARPPTVLAEEQEKPTASADVGFFSKYIWRGYELSDDSLVIQPSTTVGYRSFSLNLWGNLDTNYDSGSDTSQFNETDLTFAYHTSLALVDLGVGYIYYGLDGTDDSQELYSSVGLDTFLAPTLTIYREVAHMPSWYLNLGVSHCFDLPSGVSLDFAGSVGYYYSDDDSFVEVDDSLNPTKKKYRNFHDALISVDLAIPLGKYSSVSPVIAYSFPLTSEADNLVTSTSFSDASAFLYGGATLSISF